MSHTSNCRIERRNLVDKLMVEYAGAVPPGQILAAVTRAHRLVTKTRLGRSIGDMTLCEAVARRSLADRIISGARATAVAS